MLNNLKNNESQNIEKQVDEILSKNKDKVDKINLKKTSDIYCVKNKSSIYYLKKKSDKPNKEIKSGLLSEKIMEKARMNLGEKPSERKNKNIKNQDNLHKKPINQRLKFKRILINEIKNYIEVNKKEHKKVSSINNYFKTKNKVKKSSSSEKIDENPYFEVEILPKRNEQNIINGLQSKNNVQDKHVSINNKNNLNNIDINNDLIEKHYSDNTKKFFKNKKEPIIKEDKSFDKTKNFNNIFGVSKEKKSFFKKRDVKTDDKINKSLSGEKANKNSYFKVENLPHRDNQDNSDTSLLNNKIQEFLKKNIDIKSANKNEKKSFKLTEKHNAEKEIKILKNETQINQTNKINIQTPAELNIIKKDSNAEHVFFDEENSSFTGWSPQKTNNDKKSVFQSLTPKREVPSENLPTLDSIALPKNVLQSKTVKLSDLGFIENEWEELDFYPIVEPFAYVEILKEKESLDKVYFLVELALTEEEENLIAFIIDTMSKITIDPYKIEEKGEDDYLIEKLDQIISEYDLVINEEQRKKIYYYISKTTLGLGKIDPLMKDSNIEDLSCDGANVPLFLYHRKYGSLKCNIKFNNEDELSSFVHKLAQKCGKQISIAEPMLDATMPDGSRIQMTLSDEITARGSTFTIRKFREDPFSPPDLFELNTLSSEMIAYMWIAVENGINTLFAGGTASGKTTTLNALSLFIPREAKIVSIEETREINLPHPNWIPGVARSGFGDVVADKIVGEIDMYDLMKAALRQRPEYILVGEIRGKEAYVLFQAMATGHATYSTVHANSAQALIHRLEGKPINIPRIMLQSLDIVCFHIITRVKNKRARRCSQIIEIVDIDPTTKEILTNEVFHWDPIEDKYIFSGKSYILERIRAEKDMSREQMTVEINNRMQIIEWMNKNNIREFKGVAKIVSQYSESPQDTLKMIVRDAKINE